MLDAWHSLSSSSSKIPYAAQAPDGGATAPHIFSLDSKNILKYFPTLFYLTLHTPPFSSPLIPSAKPNRACITSLRLHMPDLIIHVAGYTSAGNTK
jgi:hypothetical protein